MNQNPICIQTGRNFKKYLFRYCNQEIVIYEHSTETAINIFKMYVKYYKFKDMRILETDTSNHYIVDDFR